MRIVLDTNVLIAAALKGGFSEDILGIMTNTAKLIVSKEILRELAEKLTIKFHWNYADVKLFIDYIRKISEIVDAKEELFDILRDPDDNKILSCAVTGKVNMIVTADQDLIKLKTFRGIAIVHPKTLSWTFPKYFKKSKR